MKASTFKYSRSEAEASIQRVSTGKQKHEPRRGDETVEEDGKREDNGVGLIQMPFEPNPDQISLLPKILAYLVIPVIVHSSVVLSSVLIDLPSGSTSFSFSLSFLIFMTLSSYRLSYRLRLTQTLSLLNSLSSYIIIQ